MTTQHLSIDELADAAEGLLDPERAAFAESHIAGCTECRAQSEALHEITGMLRTEPPLPMPGAVAHRLNDVVAAESAMRTDVWKPKRTLGTFGEDLKKSSKSRWALPALAAAAVAAVVGFGAYLISASAGLNEPPVVAAVHSSDLGLEARALEQAAGGLSPHRFSQAWAAPARSLTGVSPALQPAEWMARRHCWFIRSRTSRPWSPW